MATATKTKAKTQLTLQALLVTALQQQLWVSKQKISLLEKVAKKATSERLKEAIERHIEETEQHIERIEQALPSLEAPVKVLTHPFLYVARDSFKAVFAIKDDTLRDASIIAALQRLTHVEIADYSTATTWADLLGLDEASDLLKESLDESKTFDEIMVEIAESDINVEGAAETSSDED